MSTSAQRPSQQVTIPEDPIKELTDASPTGYARSKIIAERMLERAVVLDGARAVILRIGQIIPSQNSGSMLWNPNEMIPLLIRSALGIRSLPETPGGGDRCSWIDVHSLSKTILDISHLDRVISGEEDKERLHLVYNLVHPRPCSWKADFLPALKKAGLVFEVVDWQTWLEKLRSSEKDVKKNPSRKMLAFWEAQNIDGEGKEIKFETAAAEGQSDATKNMGRVVDEEYVAKLLDAWRIVWSVST